MYRSKVKATPEEIQSLKDQMNTPLIMLQCGPMGPSPAERCHEMALAHGLPEQSGFYGIDGKTGEFLSEFPIAEPTQ